MLKSPSAPLLVLLLVLLLLLLLSSGSNQAYTNVVLSLLDEGDVAICELLSKFK